MSGQAGTGGAANGELVGTGGLIRLILRRDRVILPVWLLATVGIVLQWAGTAATVYPTPASRQQRLEEVTSTPMFLLFQGQMFDANLGSVIAQRAVAQGALLGALGAALLLVRHTRTEEQSGRRELLGSTVVGRHAPLTAPLIVLVCSGTLIAAACASGLVAAGLPVAGSVCAGLIIGSAVWMTAATTAVFAQLTQSARAAAIGGFAAFFGLHLLRGVGAMGGDSTVWLTWVTPNGWLENARPFADERWWVFGLVALWVLVFGGVAYALSVRRDLGAGMLPARLGPGRAAPSLSGPFGLAWRMHRVMLLVWIVGAAVFGLLMGLVGSEAMDEYARSPWVLDLARQMHVDDPADALFLYIIAAMAIMVGIHAVMTAQRVRTEETGGGAEAVLAEPVTRRRWLASHLAFAIVSPVLILSALGLGLGFGSGITGGDLGAELVGMLSLTTPLTPAIWVIAGVTAAAFGLVPRVTAVIGWAALGIGIAAELAVKASVLPTWVFLSISPFPHASPAYAPGAGSYLALVLLTAGLIALGTVAFGRRDLST